MSTQQWSTNKQRHVNVNLNKCQLQQISTQANVNKHICQQIPMSHKQRSTPATVNTHIQHTTCKAVFDIHVN